jgi:hypothetical protein
MTISVNFEPGNNNVRLVRIVTDSTLAQVTTAGWYNNAAPNQLVPSDLVEVAYLQGLSGATTAIFSVSITAGVVTLSLDESSVVLPVVAGHFANFNGTAGAIADDGYLPSNPALTRVVMQSAASVAGNIPQYNDITGTLVDSGLAESNIVAKNAVNTMAAGSSVVLAKVNGTEAANAVTASGVAGVITTSALTIAAGSTYSITWTNTFISATSSVLLTLRGGTNTVETISLVCTPGSGTATLVINNIGPTNALNGTVLISYVVL